MGELTALPDPLARFGGRFAAGGGAGLGKRRGRGGRGKWRGRKGPQVTVQPQPCYATDPYGTIVS